MSLSSSGQTNRLPSVEDLLSSVRGIQQFAAVRAGANKGKRGNMQKDEEQVALELRTPGSNQSKYSIYIAELKKTCSLKFAVFIVPQGRLVTNMHKTGVINDPHGQTHSPTSSDDYFHLKVWFERF